MSYQSSTPVLAEKFFNDLQAFARELHAVVPRDEKESAFLQDLGRGRYPMVALQRLMQLAARSPKSEHREFLAEIVRRECGATSSACIAAAFEQETVSNGDANLAQMQYINAPGKATLLRCRETLMRQLSATRVALDAVLSHRMWQ